MAPEMIIQERLNEVGKQTNIWNFGVLIFELVTGSSFFLGFFYYG